MQVRPATPEDDDAIWRVLEAMLRAGETYALPRDMSRTDALAYWTGGERQAFVAVDASGRVVGTYFLRANQPGGGSHVANCGYVTAEDARRSGAARAMCLHSLAEARARGFRAMQFNFVVSSNEDAVRLWQSLGFEIVGRLPAAFQHPRLGYVDVLVMYRDLARSN
jgi:ribosomal protein S18 acetylase RimI-like enzyme